MWKKCQEFPSFDKEGTDLRSVQRANQGWLGEFGDLDHPLPATAVRQAALFSRRSRIIFKIILPIIILPQKNWHPDR
jgi:hypothetical protein